MKWFPSSPLSPCGSWAIPKGVLQLLFVKADPGSSACPAWLIAFFSPGYVFLPSGPVRWGESRCLWDWPYLHLSAVSPGSVWAGSLLPQGFSLKWSPSDFWISLLPSVEFQDRSYHPFPTRSGWVPLFPSAKALGLICFPGWEKTEECEREKRGHFPPFLASLLPLFLLFFLTSSISSSSSEFHSRNVRTPSGLLQTKLKQQQPLEIKKTSLRI